MTGREGPPDLTQSKALGKGMSVLAWVTLLGLLTLFFQDRLADQANPNRDVSSGRGDDGYARARRQAEARFRIDDVRIPLAADFDELICVT